MTPRAALNTAVMFSRDSDNWETPAVLFDALDAEFHFDLDGAATADNSRCEQWSGNFLAHPWQDWAPITIWLNPPYSRVGEFVAKSAEAAAGGNTVVMLLPSRTDTRYWHEYIWDETRHQPRPGVEVRFIKGRLKFSGASNSAPFPSVVVVFRPVAVSEKPSADKPLASMTPKETDAYYADVRRQREIRAADCVLNVDAPFVHRPGIHPEGDIEWP